MTVKANRIIIPLASLLCLLSITNIIQAQTPMVAENRYALVIGNSEYEGIPSLNNPVNDAIDMQAALERLGFTVELLTNASQSQMESAVVRLGGRLGSSKQAVGLFYYAGHGIQSSTGVNYLIPSRVSIPSEDFLSEKAVSTQAVLNTLNSAGNTLNLVILDACRDNPYGWARSGTRGLAVVGQQPAGSIVMYATGANSVAQDGTGRNGVFTGELLRQLETPGLEIGEVVRRTGAAVQQVTGGKQIPAVSNQFFRTFYLKPAATGSVQPSPSVQAPSPRFGTVIVATGSLSITVTSAATVSLLGQTVELPAGATLPINNVAVGEVTVAVRYADGKSENRSVWVEANRSSSLAFDYCPVPEKITEFWINASTFSSRTRAEEHQKSMTNYGLTAGLLVREIDGTPYFRVRIGPYDAKNEADDWLTTIRRIADCEEAYVYMQTVTRSN